MKTTLKDVHQSHNNKAINSVASAPTASDAHRHPKRPIWEIIVEIGSQISDEEWAKVPDDASINYKHYLYGAPRKNV